MNRMIIPTASCHALMEYTKEKYSNDKATALMDLLFDRYFVKGEMVHKVEILKDCYTKLDLVWDNTTDEALDENSIYIKKVNEKDEIVKNKRISGVPCFIIERVNGTKPITFSGIYLSVYVKSVYTNYIYLYVYYGFRRSTC
jgi:predicted DsbA family dithiol-disulfide isomerase